MQEKEQNWEIVELKQNSQQVNSLSTSVSDSSLPKNPAMMYLMSLPSKRSRTTMLSFLGQVSKMVGTVTVEQFDWGSLRRQHIQAVVAMLSSKGLAPSTINTYLAALKGVALESWALGMMDAESYQQVKTVKSVRGKRLPKGRALSRREIQALYEACNADSNAAARDAAMIAILAGCGLRRAEVVALDLADVDFEEGSIKVVGKGNKEREAFMPMGAQKRLKQWLEHRGQEPGALFQRVLKSGRVAPERLSAQAVYHVLQQRQTQAGVKSFAPHDMRRTFASMLLENGEDIITVKDAMGHESVATTQKYDRRGNDRLKQASERLRV